MNRWPWDGIVATILALSVGISFCAVMIITAVQKGPVTEGGAAMLNTLAGALVGAVGGWLGSNAYTKKKRREDETEDEAP